MSEYSVRGDYSTVIPWSNPTRPELYTRRLVLWMSFVFAIALGAGALAANIPGLVVSILLLLTGGAVGYFAYYERLGGAGS